MAFLWDMDEHKEVTFLAKPQEFNSPDSYVPNGFVPFAFRNWKNQKMNDIKYFKQNENSSFLMVPKTDQMAPSLHRTFTEVNLEEVFQMRRNEVNGIYMANINIETALQNFNGLTFFQIFRTNPEYLQLIENQINEKNLPELVDIHKNGQVSDNIIIRQIYYLLNMPVMLDYQHEAILRPNVLHLTLFDREHQHMLDSLLRLVAFSREQKLSDLVVNFECF